MKHAMHYVSQNLVKCRNVVQQIAVMELPTGSKQPRLIDCHIGVVNKLENRGCQRVWLKCN